MSFARRLLYEIQNNGCQNHVTAAYFAGFLLRNRESAERAIWHFSLQGASQIV
jgi:hypothetical protein